MHKRGEVIRNLPDNEQLTEILTEIPGESGQNGSNSVKIGSFKTEPRNRLEPASLQAKVPKRVSETLVEVAGIETELSKYLIFNALHHIYINYRVLLFCENRDYERILRYAANKCRKRQSSC